jgi:hypothetical protein
VSIFIFILFNFFIVVIDKRKDDILFSHACYSTTIEFHAMLNKHKNILTMIKSIKTYPTNELAALDNYSKYHDHVLECVFVVT